jgi:hypothetical protein
MSYNVIENPVGAADVTVANGKLTITGAPTMEFLKIGEVDEIPSRASQPYVATLTHGTAANNITYSISLQQVIPELANGIKSQNFRYVSTSSATTQQLIDAFTAMINESGFEVVAVATSATVMTVTVNAGYELFTMTNTCSAANFAVASGMETQTVTAADAADQVTGTTTVTIETDAGFTVVVGDVVKITGYTGPVLTGGLGNDMYRVATVPSAVTFTLDSTTSDGVANTTDITVTKVASTPIGTYTVLTAEGIEGVSSGNTYTAFVIPFGQTAAPFAYATRDLANVHTVYINETDAQYAAARTAIQNALSGLAGGVANPEAISRLY